MSDHEEIRGLIPAYALDVLDPEEAARVHDHLPRCEPCRRELADYLRVVDAMALSAPEVQPPAGLEDRVLRQALLSATGRAAQGAAGRRRTWGPGLAAAAAVLVFFLAAGNILQWVHSPGFQARTKRLVTVALVGTGANREAYGTMVVDKDDNEGVLAVRGLPQLAPDSRYQLWLKKDHEVQSGGLFSVDAEGYGSLLVKIPQGFRGFRAFSVSVEPARGSNSPTGSPVLTGGL